VAKRIAEIVIIAEDLRQGNLAKNYLKRDGHSYRNMRLDISPPSRGSGEQFVRERYPEEVQYYRSHSTHRKAALVVMIDADKNTVAYREGQLERPARKKSEKIALLIPKRHIETWIPCLTGDGVDEATDYKSTKDIDGKIKQAAEPSMTSRDGSPVPDGCVSSLKKGLKEIRRVD
jgi:hypothetical protein